jgi:ABC-type uncharacterized transport system permease subunit
VNFTILFWGLFGVYATGWLFCVLSFFRNMDKVRVWGERILFFGLFFQIFIIVVTYIQLEGFLFDSLSGLLLFLSLLMIVIYFILNRYFSNQIFAIVFPPVTLFFLALSILVSDQAIIAKAFLDKSPVFGRYFLYIHASFSMIGYLLFGVACLTSIFFMYQEKQIKNKTLLLKKVRVPSLGFLDALNYKVITAGFIFLTIGLLVGINMKIVSAGGFPETSLRQVLPIVTWAIYAFFLVDRFINGLRGQITAIWSIMGFLAAVVSFIYEISFLIEKR